MPFRLLIVDDNAVTLVGLYDALHHRFPEAIIATAESAEEALKQLDSVPFDVVLSDVQMPGMDGMGLLREIKTSHPMCVVFLMTAHGLDLHQEALRLGASAFLDKPLDMQSLGRLLSRAVDHTRLLNSA